MKSISYRLAKWNSVGQKDENLDRESFQSRKQTGSKTSRLHEKSSSSDLGEQDLPRCQKGARKQRAMRVGTSHAREQMGKNPTRGYDFS